MAKATFEIVIQDQVVPAAKQQANDAKPPAVPRSSPVPPPTRSGGAGDSRGGTTQTKPPGAEASSDAFEELKRASAELGGIAKLLGAGGLLNAIKALGGAAQGLTSFVTRVGSQAAVAHNQAPEAETELKSRIPRPDREIRRPTARRLPTPPGSRPTARRLPTTRPAAPTPRSPTPRPVVGSAGRAVAGRGAAGALAGGAGGSAASAAGAGAGGAAAAGLSATGIGLIVVAVVAALAAAVIAVRKWNRAMDDQTQKLEGFSGELSSSASRKSISEERVNFEAAQRNGALLARRQNRQTRLEEARARIALRVNEKLLLVNEHISKLIEPLAEAAVTLPERIDAFETNVEAWAAWFTGNEEQKKKANEAAKKAQEDLADALRNSQAAQGTAPDPFMADLLSILDNAGNQRPRRERRRVAKPGV